MSEKQILKEMSYKTVYREGNVLVKQFVPSHPKSLVFNEAFIQTSVEESGVCVPKILGVVPEDGGWAIRMEYMEGKTLAEMLQEEGANEEELLGRLVDIQIDVGSHRASRLQNTRTKLAAEIENMDGLDPSVKYELLQRIHGMRNHTKLCHGDLVPSNIIIRADGSAVILDWSHATSGNAGADAAITYMHFCLEDPGRAEKYLRIFSKKAGMPIQYIQTWLPIVAAHQLKKHNPEETEMLEKWISVAEYQ